MNDNDNNEEIEDTGAEWMFNIVCAVVFMMIISGVIFVVM